MIIGLSGYARSGKDTVANILVENYGFTRVAFADKIRTLLYELNPKTGNDINVKDIVDDYGWEIAKINPEIRRLLQDLGTGARKTMDDQIWIHALFSTLDLYGNHYVISDVRFKNEFEFVKELGGQLWQIKRNGVEAINNHISETDLESFSFNQVIENNGSIEDLKTLITSFKISTEELQEYKNNVL